MDFEGVDAVFVDGLGEKNVRVVRVSVVGAGWREAALTCGGPRMVPFQLVMRRSSPSSRP